MILLSKNYLRACLLYYLNLYNFFLFLADFLFYETSVKPFILDIFVILFIIKQRFIILLYRSIPLYCAHLFLPCSRATNVEV
jgi:hypothetical protein